MDWQTEVLKSFGNYIVPILATMLMAYAAMLAPALFSWAQSKAKASGNSVLYATVTIAVKAAEQVLAKYDGAARLKYVEEFLTKRGLKFDPAMVEAAVYALKLEQIASGAKAAPVQYTTGFAQVGTMVAGTPTVTTTSQAADTQG